LGESLAKFEASLLLALLVDRFEFSPIPDRVYQKAMGITLSVSNGMELNVKRLGKI
jgi:cytochrome P450